MSRVWNYTGFAKKFGESADQFQHSEVGNSNHNRSVSEVQKPDRLEWEALPVLRFQSMIWRQAGWLNHFELSEYSMSLAATSGLVEVTCAVLKRADGTKLRYFSTSSEIIKYLETNPDQGFLLEASKVGDVLTGTQKDQYGP